MSQAWRRPQTNLRPQWQPPPPWQPPAPSSSPDLCLHTLDMTNRGWLNVPVSVNHRSEALNYVRNSDGADTDGVEDRIEL